MFITKFDAFSEKQPTKSSLFACHALSSIIVLIDCPPKLLHRCLSRLADALAVQHLAHSQPQNFEVKPEGEVVHIPDIQGELLLPGNRIASVDLRPAGDAGATMQAILQLQHLSHSELELPNIMGFHFAYHAQDAALINNLQLKKQKHRGRTQSSFG